MNESGGDFHQGGCLYKLTSGINEHLSTCGRLTGLRNKPQKKLTSQLLAVVLQLLVSILMELSIGDEKRSCHCVYKWLVFASPVTHTHAHTHARTHASTHTHTHAHTQAHTHTNAHTHTCKHTHTHAHTHTHTHTRKHTHTHILFNELPAQ